MHWWIRQDVLDDMRVRASAGIRVTDEQQKLWAAELDARRSSDGPRGLTKAGSVAEISIEGVLVPKMDFLMWLFGMEQTAYSDIAAALAAADADPDVKSIVFNVNSPGGRVDGLFDCIAAIQATSKPKSVVAAQACSGAYALAAVAGPIRAKNAAAQFGSIGVAATFQVSNEVIDVTSTEAPDKRPDPRTEEGKATIRAFLDQVHDLFVGEIATALGTTKENVNANFGRGATLLAGEAKKRGMIHSITKPKLTAVKAAENIDPSADDGGPNEEVSMNLEQLKAQHPELYKLAVAEGVTEGVNQERGRVNGHLKLAETTGATKVAFEAIRAGKSVFDPEVHADYMAVSLKGKERDDRQDDSNSAGDATSGTSSANTQGKDLGDQVVERLAAMRGGKKVA